MSQKEITKIYECEEQEIQIKMLRKCRYKLLGEINGKQQSLATVDYMLCKIKDQPVYRSLYFHGAVV